MVVSKDRAKAFLAGRRFGLIELACVTAAGLIWYFVPQVGGWPLMLGLPPVLVRQFLVWPARRFTFLHFVTLGFLASAAAGAFLSYDSQQAGVKFWVLVGAVLLYFAIADQPEDNLSAAILVVGLWMSALSLYFAAHNDFFQQPSGFAVVDQIGRAWSRFRPWQPGRQIPNDVVGGVIAILFPLLVASTWQWRKQKIVRTMFITTLAAAAFGTAITGSHAAMLALVVGVGVFMGLVGLRFYSPKRPDLTRAIKARWPLVAAIALVLLLPVLLAPGFVTAWLHKAPGWSGITDRLHLFENTTYLIGDFVFTGGGLASFPGLYSQYVLDVPDFFLGYGHSLFLDLWIEQGLIGVTLMVVLIAGAIWQTGSAWLSPLRRRDLDILRMGLLSSLVAMGFHGLIEDALYGLRGTGLLLALIGLSVAIWLLDPVKAGQGTIPHDLAVSRSRRMGWKVIIPPLAIALAALFVFRLALLSTWYANLGSVEMARVQLASFPNQNLQPPLQAFSLARSLFQRALQFDSSNRTANYRLGMIAYEQGNYPAAIPFLQAAYQRSPGYHGVEKLLGYSYTWMGQTAQATVMLRGIVEARKELHGYIEWWGKSR